MLFVIIKDGATSRPTLLSPRCCDEECLLVVLDSCHLVLVQVAVEINHLVEGRMIHFRVVLGGR